MSRIGAAADRAFESGVWWIPVNRAVWLLDGDIIYKQTDPATADRYEAWIANLTAEKAAEAATLAAEWYGSMDDLIRAVEEL